MLQICPLSPHLRRTDLSLSNDDQNHCHVVAVGGQNLAILYNTANYLIGALFSLKLVVFFADEIRHLSDAHRLEDAVSGEQNEIIT